MASDVCPKCGAAGTRLGNGDEMFKCDTVLDIDGDVFQSGKCHIAELEAALAASQQQVMNLSLRVDEERKQREKVERKLFDEQTHRAAACRAHDILSKGIKKALQLEVWPDFHKKDGPGLFADSVAKLLLEEIAKLRALKSKGA